MVIQTRRPLLRRVWHAIAVEALILLAFIAGLVIGAVIGVWT